MTQKIVRLIRHASTPATAGKRFIGTTDMGLSGKGRGEARRLKRVFADRGADIWCSPMKRCLETARLAGAGFRARQSCLAAGSNIQDRNERDSEKRRCDFENNISNVLRIF